MLGRKASGPPQNLAGSGVAKEESNPKISLLGFFIFPPPHWALVTL